MAIAAKRVLYILVLMVLLASTNAFANDNQRGGKTVYVTKDTNLQSQLSQSATTYIITCDVDLKGQTVSIPKNAILRFESKRIGNGTLRLNNHSRIIGNGVEFLSHPHKQMIVADGVEGVEIECVAFNSRGNKHSSYESAGVFVKNSKNVNIHDCSFEGDTAGLSGYMGLAMLKVEQVEIYKNEFRDIYKPDFWKSNQRNTAWATYLVSLKTANIYGNKFYKTYSGIKLTGFIEDVKIYSNETYDNITDGCDFAGISARNVVIENNKFENCGDCGVEFKILFFNAWHYDEMTKYYGYARKTTRYFKDITIRNNTISSWVGLKIWNQYNQTEALTVKTRRLGYNKRNGGIELSNNNLLKTKTGSGSPNSSVGIQVAFNAMKQGDFVVINNKIDDYKFGVYFVNSSNISVSGNSVRSSSYCVYERFEMNEDLNQDYNHDIRIESNTFHNTHDYAIILSERTRNWDISNNVIETTNRRNMIKNKGFNNKLNNNRLK